MMRSFFIKSMILSYLETLHWRRQHLLLQLARITQQHSNIHVLHNVGRLLMLSLVLSQRFSKELHICECDYSVRKCYVQDKSV